MAEIWRKSTYSTTGNCLEVAQTGGGVAVRDSKDPDGPRLTFSGVEWAAFLAGIKAGGSLADAKDVLRRMVFAELADDARRLEET